MEPGSLGKLAAMSSIVSGTRLLTVGGPLRILSFYHTIDCYRRYSTLLSLKISILGILYGLLVK